MADEKPGPANASIELAKGRGSGIPNKMRIATFNLQNLRLRHVGERAQLDAARDGDMPDREVSAALANADRRLTARVLNAANADIVALQEVFDKDALDHFHDVFLTASGAPPYPYRTCSSGNDGRGLNVAALSRQAQQYVESHATATSASLGLNGLPEPLREGPIFRRDCLEIGFQRFVLFVCHFKAPYPDRERAWIIRQAEARAVRRIVETRFSNPKDAHWIIIGDFNEPGRSGVAAQDSALGCLTKGFAIDLADRADQGDDWTYETPDSHIHSRPDRILVSPKLGNEFPQAYPRIIRAGTGPSQPGSGTDKEWRPHASDHALVFADFPGL